MNDHSPPPGLWHAPSAEDRQEPMTGGASRTREGTGSG